MTTLLFSVAFALDPSLSVRGDLAGSTPRVGLEGRLAGPLFGRARVAAYAGANQQLFAILRDLRTGPDDLEETNWVARTGSLELAGTPHPAVRIGGTLGSDLWLPRKGYRYLVEENGVSPDTRGHTWLGPTAWFGSPGDTLQLYGRLGLHVPVTARWGTDEPPTSPDGTPYAPRQLHRTRVDSGLEARIVRGALVVDAELGVRMALPSRFRQDQGVGRTVWDPTASVGIGFRPSSRRASR